MSVAFIGNRQVTLHAQEASQCLQQLKQTFGLYFFERFAEVDIPKTTNFLEGRFGDMKQKLRCHQGMRKENKIRFIKDYFSRKNLNST